MYLGEDATILFKLGNMSYVMCDLISKKVLRSVYRTVQWVDKASLLAVMYSAGMFMIEDKLTNRHTKISSRGASTITDAY